MNIWVDADACPVAIKEILFRAAIRTATSLTLVANRTITIPRSPLISFVRVSSGSDVADNEIINRLEPGDLVITADIPLAAEVIENKGHAINPRGRLYTIDNIKDHLSMRDFADTLRASGINTGGPPTFSKIDCQTFANQLDRFLTAQKQTVLTATKS